MRKTWLWKLKRVLRCPILTYVIPASSINLYKCACKFKQMPDVILPTDRQTEKHLRLPHWARPGRWWTRLRGPAWAGRGATGQRRGAVARRERAQTPSRGWSPGPRTCPPCPPTAPSPASSADPRLLASSGHHLQIVNSIFLELIQLLRSQLF